MAAHRRDFSLAHPHASRPCDGVSSHIFLRCNAVNVERAAGPSTRGCPRPGGRRGAAVVSGAWVSGGGVGLGSGAGEAGGGINRVCTRRVRPRWVFAKSSAASAPGSLRCCKMRARLISLAASTSWASEVVCALRTHTVLGAPVSTSLNWSLVRIKNSSDPGSSCVDAFEREQVGPQKCFDTVQVGCQHGAWGVYHVVAFDPAGFAV